MGLPHSLNTMEYIRMDISFSHYASAQFYWGKKSQFKMDELLNYKII